MQAVVFAIITPRMMAGMPSTVTTSSSSGTTYSYSTSATIGMTTAPAAASAGPGSGLTPQQVQAVVARVQAAAGNALDAGQVTALTGELTTGATPLVPPQYVWTPIQSVNMGGDGTATIVFNGGETAVIPPGGATVQTSLRPSFPFKVSIGSAIAFGAEAVVSFALALFLLIAGIRVLRRSPAALRHHRLYAWVKLPVALVGSVAVGWFLSEMIGSFATGPTPLAAFGSAKPLFFVVYTGWYALMGSAYPVGLLFTLRSHKVREYANTIRSSR
jgi:hypothetical protein